MAREQELGMVLSVRLSGAESQKLKAIVAKQGGRVSDVIRQAIKSYAGGERHASVEWNMPPESSLVIYVGDLPSSQSANPTPSPLQAATGTA